RDDRRHLRRDDDDASLPEGDGDRLRRRADQEFLGSAVRSRRGPGLPARARPREVRSSAARTGLGAGRGARGPAPAGALRSARPARRRSFAAAAAILAAAAACSHQSKPQPKTSAEVLLNERMAAVLLSEGQAAEAERQYREVLKDDPNNADLYDGLGSSLLMQGRPKDAVEPFDKAVKMSPKKASFRINRGLAYMELSRYADAEEDFRIADSSPRPDDRLAASINRGRLRQMQGDSVGAEEQFTTAISRDPSSFAAHLGRGVAREARG